MTKTADKKPLRLSGSMLRLTARLLETPGSGNVLFGVTSKQLGIHLLHGASIPPEVAPYRPLHLRGGDPAPRHDREEGHDA